MSGTPSTVDLSGLDLSDSTALGTQTNRGGYSAIFQGDLSQGDIRKKVAIKALRVQGSSDNTNAMERLRKRFYREVSLWKTLRHSNIVPLLGYMMLSDGSPALISPWYPNGNVIRYLETQTNPDRNSLALDIIKGLEYLHSIPIAHGDLKGENVLVDSGGHASLCDFGMSQFIEVASSITGFTTTNAYLGGTDRFMCPEILEEQPKTIATDIWALGCLIVQILTDEIPYQHIVRKHAITLAIMRGAPPMSNASGTVKESLWDCIKNCWSRDPTQRPGASDIKSHLEGSDNEVEPSGMRNSIWHKIKPNLCSSMSFTEFSPDGRFLAIVDSIGIVSILEAKNNELEPFKTWSCDKEEPGWHIRKVAWSATQRHLLIVSDRFTRIYVVETGELLKDVGPSTTAAFISDDRDVAYAQCSQRSQVSRRLRLLYFAYAGKTLSNRVSFDNNIIDLLFVSNNERAVLALTRVLLVYNLHTRAVENRVQIAEQAQMLSVSKDRRFVLVAYRSRDPELWEVAISRPELANSTSQLSLLHKYQSSDGGNGFTKIQFGGLDEELVVGLSTFRVVYIWGRDTTMPLHSISLTTNLEYVWDISFRWTTADPQDLILVAASLGELHIWMGGKSNAIASGETLDVVSRNWVQVIKHNRQTSTPDVDLMVSRENWVLVDSDYTIT